MSLACFIQGMSLVGEFTTNSTERNVKGTSESFHEKCFTSYLHIVDILMQIGYSLIHVKGTFGAWIMKLNRFNC